jgi:ubiquinone/menaquinone biosynthesis C-methylase UbiE
MTTITNEKIHEAVRTRYGRIASEFQPNCCAADAGADYVEACGCGAELYETDLTTLPSDVTGLSLGCGDPITIAELQPGQTVLDLGSGGGIDCFLAAKQVGETGYVLGVDMTPQMLEKANRNKAKMGLENVEFRQGQIEDIPVEDGTVDVIISNCVINLSPDKTAVFREAYRVLKPGGKLAVSDMVTQGRFTAAERMDMSQWAGCITGAEDVSDYVNWMRSVGFTDVSVRDKGAPTIELADSISLDQAARIFSARITAVKPGV